MSCEGCFQKCPELKPFRKENVSPADLTPRKYTSGAWDDLPIDMRNTWELESRTGRHTVDLAQTRFQAIAFREGVEECPGPKVRKVWKVTISRKCQNPSLAK